MKIFITITAALALSAAAVFAANSRPATAQTDASNAKVVVIDSEIFNDPNNGIKRLIEKFTLLDQEFKPKREELEQLRARYDQLAKEINETKGLADQTALARKMDELETLKTSIERKQQDGQSNLERRVKELTEPIYTDVRNSLQAYAQQRNIDVILDLNKLAGSVMVINNQANITSAFIADYNTRNPVKP